MIFVRMLVMCCYVRALQGGSEWTLCIPEGQGLLGPRRPNKHANTYRHPYNTRYKVQFWALGSVRHHTSLISLLVMFWAALATRCRAFTYWADHEPCQFGMFSDGTRFMGSHWLTYLHVPPCWNVILFAAGLRLLHDLFSVAVHENNDNVFIFS